MPKTKLSHILSNIIPVELLDKIKDIFRFMYIYIYIYLSFELVIFFDNGIIIGEKGIVGGFEFIIVPLKLFGLPTSAAVLKPYSHLPWLQAKILSQGGLFAFSIYS